MSRIISNILSLAIFSNILAGIFGANEEDNPVAFLRFEHHELMKDTFLREQKLVENLKKFRRILDDRRKQIKKFADSVRGRNVASPEDKACDSISAYNVMKRSAVNLPYMRSKFQDDLSAITPIR